MDSSWTDGLGGSGPKGLLIPLCHQKRVSCPNWLSCGLMWCLQDVSSSRYLKGCENEVFKLTIQQCASIPVRLLGFVLNLCTPGQKALDIVIYSCRRMWMLVIQFFLLASQCLLLRGFLCINAALVHLSIWNGVPSVFTSHLCCSSVCVLVMLCIQPNRAHMSL